jgi:MFS family permease
MGTAPLRYRTLQPLQSGLHLGVLSPGSPSLFRCSQSLLSANRRLPISLRFRNGFTTRPQRRPVSSHGLRSLEPVPTWGWLDSASPPRIGLISGLSAARGIFLVLHLMSLDMWLPIMGEISDWIGRRPLLAAAARLALLTSYSALSWLVNAPSFGRLIAVELRFAFLFASYTAPSRVCLTEIMPPGIRTARFSIVHSTATIFGHFTPAISIYLIQTTGNRAIPELWLSFAACGLITTALLSSSRIARHSDGPR